MGNQDRPPPGVERLEPRLTLSTIRPLRQRAGVAGAHAAHPGVAAETPEPRAAPLEARSVEFEAEDPASSASDSRAPAPLGLFQRPGFAPLDDPDASEHGASGLHAPTAAQPGLIAFTADHDPVHFVLVPISQVNAVPYPTTTAAAMAHDGPAMTMGAGASSRVAVSMTMHQPAMAMPRMTRTRDARPVLSHAEPEPGPGTMEAADDPATLHPHDLDPGLEPDLSPATGVDLAPEVVLRDAPGLEVDADPSGEREALAPVDGVHAAAEAPRDREVAPSGSRVAAVVGAAAVFHRNLALGRLASDDPPETPAEAEATLLVRWRRLVRRLCRVLRHRARGHGAEERLKAVDPGRR